MGQKTPPRNGLVSAPPCASRRVTRPSGKWGYSARCRMLGHECLVVVLPERALYLLTFSHLLIVNKPSSSSSFLSLSLSLSPFGARANNTHTTPPCRKNRLLRLLRAALAPQGARCACSSKVRAARVHPKGYSALDSRVITKNSIQKTAHRTPLPPKPLAAYCACSSQGIFCARVSNKNNPESWIHILPVMCTLRDSPDQVPLKQTS